VNKNYDHDESRFVVNKLKEEVVVVEDFKVNNERYFRYLFVILTVIIFNRMKFLIQGMFITTTQ
jgi:hypothetical protein